MSRISPGTLLLAIVAVLFGLLGAYIVRQNLNSPTQAAEEKVTIVVPTAGTDLIGGRQVAFGDIAVYKMTREQLKEAGIKGVFMTTTTQIIGRTIKQDMKKGEVFRMENMYQDGVGPNVVDMLKPGQRAITVPVEVNSAVGGFARPGTFVDVLFRSDAGEDENIRPETTVTLINKVKVLAFNEQTFSGALNPKQSNRNKPANVTLAVDAFEAASLRIVDGRGTLSLALRHPDDIAGAVPASLAPRTLDELLKIPPPNKHEIEVYRGNHLTSVEFDKGDRRTPTTFVIAKDQNNNNNQGATTPPPK